MKYTIRIILALVALALVIRHEVGVTIRAAEFRAMDQAAVMAGEAVYAYDVLAYDPRGQRAILPAAELAARTQRVNIEAERIIRRANDLEHEIAYPCTIRTLYRECLR
jgi:hypothetical protein